MGGLCSTRASADTSFWDGYCSYHTGYDVPAGRLHSGLWGGIYNCWIWSIAKVEDDFTVTGLAPGTSVPLTARLDFTAQWQCGACVGSSAAYARVTTATSSVSWETPSCNETNLPDCQKTTNSSITAPVQAVAGTPFRVTFETWGAAGESFSGMDGAFSFDGLPQGAVIHSCQGYEQGVVPTRPASWGSLKARYR
jgi:hypothetical protein